MIDIDKMQYGFMPGMPGRGTVNAVFVLRTLNEKFGAKNVVFIFFDLEKLFIECQGKLFILL